MLEKSLFMWAVSRIATFNIHNARLHVLSMEIQEYLFKKLKHILFICNVIEFS